LKIEGGAISSLVQQAIPADFACSTVSMSQDFIGAVDLGYRVVVVKDAICSSSDEGHDALLQVYRRRYSEQIETVDAEAVLSRWR
jgi:nicotinamidase-related amidase